MGTSATRALLGDLDLGVRVSGTDRVEVGVVGEGRIAFFGGQPAASRERWRGGYHRRIR
jgi:hypothetical protein